MFAAVFRWRDEFGSTVVAQLVDGQVEAGEGEPGGERGASGAGEVVRVEVEAGQLQEQQPDDDECECECEHDEHRKSEVHRIVG